MHFKQNTEWKEEVVRVPTKANLHHITTDCHNRPGSAIAPASPKQVNQVIPDSKVHGANMGPTWNLSAPDGPHVVSMNLAIGDACANSLLTNDQITSM